MSRALTPAEERLVDAVRAHLSTLAVAAEEADRASERVRAALAARRPVDDDGSQDAAADRVHPVLVARAVAAVARPRLRADRDHATVRVADATPRHLLAELSRRLWRRRRWR